MDYPLPQPKDNHSNKERNGCASRADPAKTTQPQSGLTTLKTKTW